MIIYLVLSGGMVIMLPRTQKSLCDVSLAENLRAKEGGKEKTGEASLPSHLSPSHGPLLFVTSHSRFALASVQKRKRPIRRLVIRCNLTNA